MMLGVSAYTYYSNRKRGKSSVKEVYLMSAATVLIMVDPTRNLLADYEVWPSPQSDMYSCEAETYNCLTLVGGFTITFTYLGFAFLALGTMWSAELGKKFSVIRRKWKIMHRKKVAPPTVTVVDQEHGQDQDQEEKTPQESDRLLGASRV